MTKKIKQLKPGDIITRVPYGEPSDYLPLKLHRVAHAQRPGCRILIGDNEKGERVMIPVGHFTNEVEVK